MTNQTVELNENLVKIDNLLKGLEFLYEEIETRKEEMIKAINLENIVKVQMRTDYFMNEMSYFIRNHYGDGIAREVSYIVMNKIDRDIDSYINDRVNAALARAGAPNRPTNSSTSENEVRYRIDWNVD
jgi:hypothetical protein